MAIIGLDHLVLTVKNIKTTTDFYHKFFGIETINFQNGRTALKLGHQKINLHELGHEIDPKAEFSTPGSGDICLISDKPIDDLLKTFQKNNLHIVLGPVLRTGAEGKIKSIYVRDPDQNLIEISNYI